MRDNRLNSVPTPGCPATASSSTSANGHRIRTVRADALEPRRALAAERRRPVRLGAIRRADHHLTDGVDNSGARNNSALSGSVGRQLVARRPLHSLRQRLDLVRDAYHHRAGQRAQWFAADSTTELKPQRAVNYEIGARGRPTKRIDYSVAFFLGRIKDAIVQQEEVGGRAFFVNAGKTHNDGAEIGLNITPIDGLTLSGAYTYARYRFADYKVVGHRGDTLDGNRLPGVPEHYWRLGLRTALPRGFYLDADHTISSSIVADDANTIFVDAWGAGVTNARIGWSGDVGSMNLAPFLGVNNLWDRQYVGSVTLNGAFGRVIEPAPRRVIYVGTGEPEGEVPQRPREQQLKQHATRDRPGHAHRSPLDNRPHQQPGRATPTSRVNQSRGDAMAAARNSPPPPWACP